MQVGFQEVLFSIFHCLKRHDQIAQTTKSSTRLAERHYALLSIVLVLNEMVLVIVIVRGIESSRSTSTADG